MISIRMAHEAAAIYRAIGMPVQAIVALGNEFAVWRREARPLSDRLAMARAMWAELESMPDTADVLRGSRRGHLLPDPDRPRRA